MIPELTEWPSCCKAVHGSAAQCSTVRCVMYRWCCSVVGVTAGLAVAAGDQVVLRTSGFARRLRCGCGCCALVASFPVVRV